MLFLLETCQDVYVEILNTLDYDTCHSLSLTCRTCYKAGKDLLLFDVHKVKCLRRGDVSLTFIPLISPLALTYRLVLGRNAPTKQIISQLLKKLPNSILGCEKGDYTPLMYFLHSLKIGQLNPDTAWLYFNRVWSKSYVCFITMYFLAFPEDKSLSFRMELVSWIHRAYFGDYTGAYLEDPKVKLASLIGAYLGNNTDLIAILTPSVETVVETMVRNLVNSIRQRTLLSSCH